MKVRSTQVFEFIGRIVAQFPSDGQVVRAPSAFIQPIVTDDVAAVLVDVALAAPVNGIIDVAGPERFRFDSLIRHFLRAPPDSRMVVTPTDARYFGARLDDDSIVPRATRVWERHASGTGWALPPGSNPGRRRQVLGVLFRTSRAGGAG